MKQDVKPMFVEGEGARGGAESAAGQQPTLSIENLSKHYPGTGAPAVDGISFSVQPGDLVALLGPSGCGKTTTLRLIGGFERPDGGRILLNGRDITRAQPEKRGIGIVFQDYALFPHLSVLENVMFGLRGMARAARRNRAMEMLTLVAMADLADRAPHQLSGGQQQRVALARTLATAPPLVLLDEPFSNLDAALRQETRLEIRHMLKQAGVTAILVTHDQEEALALADNIIVMKDGGIRQVGSPGEVYRRPECEFVARFLGRANILNATANGNFADTCFGPLPLSSPRVGRVRVAARPEQLILRPDPDSNTVVAGHEYRGHDTLYWVCNGNQRLLIIANESENLQVGTRVSVTAAGPMVAFDPN